MTGLFFLGQNTEQSTRGGIHTQTKVTVCGKASLKCRHTRPAGRALPTKVVAVARSRRKLSTHTRRSVFALSELKNSFKCVRCGVCVLLPVRCIDTLCASPAQVLPATKFFIPSAFLFVDKPWSQVSCVFPATVLYFTSVLWCIAFLAFLFLAGIHRTHQALHLLSCHTHIISMVTCSSSSLHEKNTPSLPSLNAGRPGKKNLQVDGGRFRARTSA